MTDGQRRRLRVRCWLVIGIVIVALVRWPGLGLLLPPAAVGAFVWQIWKAATV